VTSIEGGRRASGSLFCTFRAEIYAKNTEPVKAHFFLQILFGLNRSVSEIKRFKVSTPKVGQTNSSVFLPIPYMEKNNILTMISSRETNLLQKSNRQSLQLIISKTIMDILYGIDSKFFRGLNDRH